jgi:hypothetical protein
VDGELCSASLVFAYAVPCCRHELTDALASAWRTEFEIV